MSLFRLPCPRNVHEAYDIVFCHQPPSDRLSPIDGRPSVERPIKNYKIIHCLTLLYMCVHNGVFKGTRRVSRQTGSPNQRTKSFYFIIKENPINVCNVSFVRMKQDQIHGFLLTVALKNWLLTD